jgi:type VI secretion system protein ImpH
VNGLAFRVAVRTAPAAPEDRPVAAWLYEEPFAFDFFQAVRLLERLEPGRRQIGGDGPPGAGVRKCFRLPVAAFPPSSIYSLEHRPTPSPR